MGNLMDQLRVPKNLAPWVFITSLEEVVNDWVLLPWGNIFSRKGKMVGGHNYS